MQELLARARGELRYEPILRRIRATAAGETVVDSARAVLVWEPRRVVPTYAVPEEDIAGALEPAPDSGDEVEGVLHPGIPFQVHTAGGEPVAIAGREGAGFRLDDDGLDGYVALDFGAFDHWYEEDERVAGHPRDPYHRVDSRRSARALRVELDGELIVDTERARFVCETQLPMRFYVPREDVRVHLQRSSLRTFCPYKGQASYWSFESGGRVVEDMLWSYEEPLPDATALAGLVSFWDERFDVYLDGEPWERAGGAVAKALADEFGV